MINFMKSLPLHLKSAFRSIRRGFANTLSSVFAVTVTLILIMLFLVTAINIGSFTTNVEESVSVFVRIDEIVEPAQYPEIEKKINEIDNVKKVTFSSKEEQFEKFVKSDFGGERYEFLADDNPLYAAYNVEVTDGDLIEKVKDAAAKIPGIYDADYGGDSATDMISAFNSVRIGGSIFVGALCILAVFLISNTIKINIHSRREEIGIMRNVGASNWFIKTPFMMEGMIIGMMGSIIPVIATIFGYGVLFDYMGGRFFTPMFIMKPPIPFAIFIALALIAVGMIVGLLGSFLSVNKYLKWKR